MSEKAVLMDVYHYVETSSCVDINPPPVEELKQLLPEWGSNIPSEATIKSFSQFDSRSRGRG